MFVADIPILSRNHIVETPRKRKNLLRADLAAKGLGRGAELFALPDAPGAYVGTVLTATPDHEGRRPTPLSYRGFYN
jgi:hypothetical protein